MTAVNDNALNTLVGTLYVAPTASPTAWVRVASVRGLNAIIDNTTNQIEINADDTGTVYKGATPEIRIEGSFLENANRDVMNLLIGGSSSDVAGSLVSGATQTLSSGAWVVNRFYQITNQNGDGSAITINSVTGGTDGALTVNDDYDVVIDANGNYGIVIQDVASATNLTTTSQDIVIDYDYTPTATEQNVITSSFRQDPTLVVQIRSDDGSGNTRYVTLSNATFEGQYNLEFLDIEEAGDLQGTTFTFIGGKGSTLTYANQVL